MKILYLQLVAGLILPTLQSCQTAQEEKVKSPNLLYIFPDQYRLNAMSVWNDPVFRDKLRTYADPVETPNIDRIARSGVFFTQATSTHPLSGPHRAMLLSGMYPSQNGVENANPRMDRDLGLHEDIVCFTDVLAQAGYETAYVGKTHWHRNEPVFSGDSTYVGSVEAPGGHYVCKFDTYIPEGKSRHGNKYWFQQMHDNHYNAIAYSNRPELVGGNKDGEVYYPKRFTTAVEADVAIKFLENKNGERDPNKPFSLIWSINPPHPPYSIVGRHCDEQLYNKYYRDMEPEELMRRLNVDLTRMVEGSDGEQEVAFSRSAGIYLTLIRSLDAEIGRLLDKLEECGEADNTIIVFTSDHGEMLGSHSVMGKNTIYDEAFLVPFIVSYPDVIEPRTDDLLLGSVDIMPTLLSMMGLKDMIPNSVAGVDYSQGVMTGEYSNCGKPKTALYLFPSRKGVRSDRYTYGVDKNGGYHLFDNHADPYQMRSIKLDDIPTEDAEMLKRELGEWLKVAQDSWFSERICEKQGLITYPL